MIGDHLASEERWFKLFELLACNWLSCFSLQESQQLLCFEVEDRTSKDSSNPFSQFLPGVMSSALGLKSLSSSFGQKALAVLREVAEYDTMPGEAGPERLQDGSVGLTSPHIASHRLTSATPEGTGGSASEGAMDKF